VPVVVVGGGVAAIYAGQQLSKNAGSGPSLDGFNNWLYESLTYPTKKWVESLFNSNDEAQAVDGAGNACDESELNPTGELVKEPSTNIRNPGGTNVQEGYVDGQGRAVTKQTILDSSGQPSATVKQPNPHFRPGPPKLPKP